MYRYVLQCPKCDVPDRDNGEEWVNAIMYMQRTQGEAETGTTVDVTYLISCGNNKSVPPLDETEWHINYLQRRDVDVVKLEEYDRYDPAYRLLWSVATVSYKCPTCKTWIPLPTVVAYVSDVEGYLEEMLNKRIPRAYYMKLHVKDGAVAIREKYLGYYKP